MSSDVTKKAKLDDGGGGDNAKVQVLVDGDSSSSSDCAVTVLTAATLEDGHQAVLFSGHRNGLVQRWNLDDNNHNGPVWRIASCTDLTKRDAATHQHGRHHPALGVAGLVVRRAQSQSQEFLLYGWNHQREEDDTRAADDDDDPSGSRIIPNNNRVLIWRCDTGERVAALIMDAMGRDARTGGRLAHPLCSCLVFGELRLLPLPPTTSKPTKDGTTANDSGDDAPQQQEVWTDVVLVGLQATCNGDDLVPPTTPTGGNLLPFDEHSRQRLAPWAASGGFVRALATVPRRYFISVTEETTAATAADSVTARDDADDDDDDDASVGKMSEIVLWDVTQPGTVLHRLDLKEMPLRRPGSAFGAWVVPTHEDWLPKFVLAHRIYATYMGFTVFVLRPGKINQGDAAHASDAVSKNPSVEMSVGLEIGTPERAWSAASVGTKLIVAATNSAGHVSKDTVDVAFFPRQPTKQFPQNDFTNPFRETLSKYPAEDASINTALCVVPGPSSMVVAGYSNGKLLMKKFAPLANVRDNDNETKANGGTANCSTAPPGLRGMLCPNLTMDAK